MGVSPHKQLYTTGHKLRVVLPAVRTEKSSEEKEEEEEEKGMTHLTAIVQTVLVRSCRLAHTSRLVRDWCLLMDARGARVRITDNRRTPKTYLESPISMRCRLMDSNTRRTPVPEAPSFSILVVATPPTRL